MIKKYGIEQIPTVLLSENANAYANLTSAWTEVGTVEEDGIYIFRDIEAIGSVTYKNLKTGKKIVPEVTQ